MRRDLATSILVTTLRYWWQIYRKKSHQHDVITKTTVATCCRFGMGKFGQIRQGLFWFFEKKYLESLFIRLSKTIFFAWFFEFFAIHSCSLNFFYSQIVVFLTNITGNYYTLLTIFEIRWRIGHHIYHRKRSVQKQRSGTLFQTEKIKLFRCPYIFSIFKQIFFWMKQKWNLPKQI